MENKIRSNKTAGVSLKLTPELKQRASDKAWNERLSLNQFIERAIEYYLEKGKYN